jgi:hypothetical protein
MTMHSKKRRKGQTFQIEIQQPQHIEDVLSKERGFHARKIMKPFWKTLTFWISVCTWATVMGGQYVGAIPSPYGLVVANFIAVLYAILRYLRKRQAGIPWKAIVFTSEFTVTGLTVLVNQLDAIKQIPSLPPWVLGGISGSIALFLVVLHTLGGTPKPSGVPDTLASEATTKLEKIKAPKT